MKNGFDFFAWFVITMALIVSLFCALTLVHFNDAVSDYWEELER
jgi:hypothetical protein